MTKLLSAIAATAAITLCAPAYAQSIEVLEDVKLPLGLKWQKVGFTSKHKYGLNIGNLTKKQQEYLYHLWGKKIDAVKKEEADRCGENISRKCTFPEELALVELQMNGTTHRFSSIYHGCDVGEIHPETRICDWRYERIDEKTGNTTYTESFKMYLDVAYKATEFAVDEKNSTVYFTIKLDLGNGILADEYCSTAIRIK